MAGVLLICLLAILPVGADEGIGGLKSCSKDGYVAINISTNSNKPTLPATEEEEKAPIGLGAEEAAHPYASIPYHVGLSFDFLPRPFVCAGALISTEYLLTSGRCPHRGGDVIVYFGARKMGSKPEAEFQMKVPKRNYIIHEEFDFKNYINNIALIRLPSAIKLTKNVELVNLPPRSLSQSKLEGKTVTASGWKTFNYVDIDFLQYAHLIAISYNKCHHTLQVLKTNICANRGEKKSSCLGESGDPLVFREPDGSRTLVGIHSWTNFRRCVSGSPIAFTYIPAYLDWISKHTGLPIKN